MPSFDIVSELDMQEVDNAVNNLKKEIVNRFDFKDSHTEITLNKKDNEIVMNTNDEMKIRTLKDLLIGVMIKRNVDTRSMEFGEIEKAGGNRLKRVIKLKSGLDKEQAKKVTSFIKDKKLKVQASIMDDKVRVTGKKIDDLQEVIQCLKQEDLDMPLQFINMKS